jgi:hypothetical protein
MSKADSIFLTAPLLLEEIERVVKDSDGSKSPGFQLCIYQRISGSYERGN